MEKVQRFEKEELIFICILSGHTCGLPYGWGVAPLHAWWGPCAIRTPTTRLSHTPPYRHLTRRPPLHSISAIVGATRGASSWNCISVCEQITPVIWPCRKLQFCSSWKIKILSWSDGREHMRHLGWTQALLIREMINDTFSWLRGSMENLKESITEEIKIKFASL